MTVKGVMKLKESPIPGKKRKQFCTEHGSRNRERKVAIFSHDVLLQEQSTDMMER